MAPVDVALDDGLHQLLIFRLKDAENVGAALGRAEGDQGAGILKLLQGFQVLLPIGGAPGQGFVAVGAPEHEAHGRWASETAKTLETRLDLRNRPAVVRLEPGWATTRFAPISAPLMLSPASMPSPASMLRLPLLFACASAALVAAPAHANMMQQIIVGKCSSAMQADFQKAGKTPPAGMVNETCTCVANGMLKKGQSLDQAKTTCVKQSTAKYNL